MPRPHILRLVAAATLAGSQPARVSAQSGPDVRAVTVAGTGSETFVLVSGLVGGVAGFRRLEARLIEQNRRVIVIDPYLLSIDSAEVSFTALARRVDRVLDSLHVTDARLVGHAHGGGVALRLAANAPLRVEHLPTVGHFPHEEAPAELTSILLHARPQIVASVPGVAR